LFEVIGMRSMEKAAMRLADPHSSIHARSRTPMKR
jgi:hypothetical protein